MARIARAVIAAAIATAAVSALWAASTTVTSPGAPPVPRLTRSAVRDYGQLAGTVTGSVPQFFAADSVICAACFMIALRRPR